MLEAPYKNRRVPKYDTDLIWLAESRGQLTDLEYWKGMRHCLQQKCLADPYFTCSYLIGYPDLYEPLHRPMIENVAFTPGEEKLCLYPRGHFKTSVITIGYAVWRYLHNPDLRILLTSSVTEDAAKIAWAIQQQFRENPRMEWLFPEWMVRTKRPAMGRFILPNRTQLFKRENSLESLGSESNVVSRHFDLALNDDIVTLACYRSEAANQQTKDFYSALNPIIDYDPADPDQTRFATIGTRWHQNDLYGDMLDKHSGFYNPELVAISMGLKHRKGPLKGQYIFPTMWTKDREKKEKMRVMRQPGGAFLWWSQYYNEARNRENQRFTTDMFIWKTRQSIAEILPYCRKYLIIDPSTTKETYSDPACFMDVRMSPTSKIYVAGIINRKMNPDELVRLLFALASREMGMHRDIYRVIFESAGLQKTYLTAIKYFSVGDPDEGRPKQTLPPIIPTTTTTKDSKLDRIDGLQPFYKRGAIQYIEGVPGMDILNGQLLSHRNNPKHDDAMDILASSVPLMEAPYVPNFVEPDDILEFQDVQAMSMSDVRALRNAYAETMIRSGRSFHGRGLPARLGAA